jgi:hypothetical protein
MFFKDLSTNPHTQYKVHMWGAIYWLINFPFPSRPSGAPPGQSAMRAG